MPVPTFSVGAGPSEGPRSSTLGDSIVVAARPSVSAQRLCPGFDPSHSHGGTRSVAWRPPDVLSHLDPKALVQGLNLPCIGKGASLAPDPPILWM